MEGCITGDVVLCIGQSAILTGREVKSLNGKMPYFQEKVSPIFIFVDDFGISDIQVKKSDYYYRYPKRCSTYFEGFECGQHIVEYILTILESSDSCQAFSIIYSADEGLGSGLTAFMVQYLANYMPGLCLLTVGILPHLSSGGLASVNTCLVLSTCLELASCCLLRRMDDTTYLLGLGTRKPAKSNTHVSVYDDVCRCLAADILLAIREMQWPLSLCSTRNKLVDIRSSLWQDALHAIHSSSSSSSNSSRDTVGRAAGPKSRGEHTHYQSLRLLSSNLHSLHLSVSLNKTRIQAHTQPQTVASSPPPPPPSPSSSISSDTDCNLAPPFSMAAKGNIAISQASILSVSRSSPTSRTFSDIDFQSPNAQSMVLSILHGATQPNVHWARAFTRSPLTAPSAFSQHRVCPGPLLPLPTARHGASGSSSSGASSTSSISKGGALSPHLSAVSFLSPYAAALLQEAIARATAVTQAGAYSYWLNNENFRECGSSSLGGGSFTLDSGSHTHHDTLCDSYSLYNTLAPTEQIEISLHNLREYFQCR